MIVRKPRLEEYKEVTNVINSEKEQWEQVLSEQELQDLHIGQETVDDLIEDAEKRNYLVAELGGKIVGFIEWKPKTHNIAWISMLQVLPSYQRQGVASGLLKKVEEQVKVEGFSAIALETQKKATWAVSFYEKHGFSVLSLTDFHSGLYEGLFNQEPVESTYIFGKELIKER